MSSSAPMTWSNPMRARRIRASFSRPASVTTTTASPGRSTSPAYSANRPSSPTLIDPRRCPEANSSAGSSVDHDRTLGLAAEHLVDVEARCVLRVVEELALGAVRVGREREVQRGDGLSLRDGLDELVLGHRRQRVVGAPLLADRRLDGGRQVLAAGRAGAVGRVDAGRVGEAQELVVDRAEQPAGEVVGGPSDRGEQVRAADVADEQGVAGEHAPRRRVVRVLPDDDRDRLGRVARGVTDLERDVAEREALPVGEPVDGEVGAGFVAVGDDRAGRRGELEVAGEEVGVEVGLDHPLDAQAERVGVGEVLRRRRVAGRRPPRVRWTRHRSGS